MRRSEVRRFFHLLSRYFKHRMTIILTGAACGFFYGRIRATMDIDFAVKVGRLPRRKKDLRWQEFARAVEVVTQRTGIAVQYAEDIDRWSSITFLDYERHTKPLERFGFIRVRLLEPPYWSIGKFARYLDPDIRDLIQILKRTKTSPRTLVRVLGQALRKSPKSTACFSFRKQVEDFLSAYGKQVWGRTYSKDEALRSFYQAAGIKL